MGKVVPSERMENGSTNARSPCARRTSASYISKISPRDGPVNSTGAPTAAGVKSCLRGASRSTSSNSFNPLRYMYEYVPLKECKEASRQPARCTRRSSSLLMVSVKADADLKDARTTATTDCGGGGCPSVVEVSSRHRLLDDCRDEPVQLHRDACSRILRIQGVLNCEGMDPFCSYMVNESAASRNVW